MLLKYFTKPLILIICVLSNISISFSQEINIGISDTLYSEILKENRAVSIYFPPSYYYKTDREYPVLYILDGDYNFTYVAGFLELQAGIAENIPEMILVAISGQGSTTYKKNCKPAIADVKDSGNAGEMLDFMEKELIPYLDRKYRTLDFKILAGHSIGGLFVVNAALERPKLFNHYIAISPALWWEKNAMNGIAKERYENKTALGTDVYVSLANEKGMGVEEFLKFTGPEFKFEKFENENHNSVGSPTYEWALRDIFKVWKTEKPYFDSAKEMVSYQSNNASAYPVSFPISDALLYNTVVYVLNEKPKELTKISEIIAADYTDSEAYYRSLLAVNAIKLKDYGKAEEVVNQGLVKYPDSFELHEKLADVYLNQDKIQEARAEIIASMALANNQKVRQWRIAEIDDLNSRIVLD